MTRLLAVALGLGFLGACNGSGEGAGAGRRSGALGGGIVARVGPVAITAQEVAVVARDQAAPPRAALELVLRDATVAAGLVNQPARVRSAERGVLARTLLERLKAEATAQGPPTDAEILAATRHFWRQHDRPRAARTVHAVAITSGSPSADERRRARQVADRLRRAVLPAQNTEDFVRLAKAVDSAGVKVKVEQLAPVAADGRVVEPRAREGSPVGRYDAAFARGATALNEPGDTSPVVESRFGYHVIRLIEWLPEQRTPLEERKRSLTPPILHRRRHAATKALLQRLRTAASVRVVRDADHLMSQVAGVAPVGDAEPGQ